MKKILILFLCLTTCVLALSQSVDGALKTLTASGTNTYTISEAFPATYTNKERFLVRFTNANTGASTLNRNSLGAKSIVKADGSALSSGDIQAGGTYLLSYNGTNYQLIGGISGAGATDNAILRADGTGGSSLQNSIVTIDDAGKIKLQSGSNFILEEPTGNQSKLGPGGQAVATITSGTNDVFGGVVIQRESTGTPANGIGGSLYWATETTANNIEYGAAIDGVVTDVTAASEDFDLVFKTMAAGATAAERFRISSTGNLFVNNTPAQDDALTQVLVRDGSTGQIKYRASSSIGGSGLSGSGTTNQLTYWSGTSSLAALSTTTYPTLDELKAVKSLPIYVDAYGAVGDGTTDNADIIQTVITNNAGKRIVIGRGTTDVYIISKAITVPSNSIIEVNGIIKLRNGNIQNLTSTVTSGSTTCTVADASAFRVGQRIVISDDNQPVNGGGAWKTRKVGKTNVIQSIVGNTITFTTAFGTMLGSGSMTAAANGKVAIAESIFLLDGVSNVIIFGTGFLDGNKANQFNIAGAYANSTAEDLKSSCGISLHNVSRITIRGLYIKDFILHGIATHDNLSTNYCDYSVFQNLTIDGQIDKAIAGLRMRNCLIDNVRNINGVDEGEIMLYADCLGVTISNCFSANNRRYGIATAGPTNRNITITNCSFDSNQTIDLYLQNLLSGGNISNLNFTGASSQTGSFTIISGKGIDIKNIKFYNMPNTNTVFSVGADGIYSSTSDDIRVDGLHIKDVNLLTTVRALSFSNTNRLLIENFSIDGVGRVFNDGTGNGLVKFVNGSINNFTTLYETNNSKFIFTNVTSSSTAAKFENQSAARIPNGSTRVVVSHRLTFAPKLENLRVTPISLGNATSWHVGNINANSFTIFVNTDPGSAGAQFKWTIENYIGDQLSEPTYANTYTSNFTAGVDSFTSTRVVSSGNNDAISDGSRSEDDVLKVYADNANNTHFITRASVFTLSQSNRITFKYFIPSAQTNVNGIRVYHGSVGASNVILDLRLGLGVVGQWVEITSPIFTPTGTSLVIDLWQTYTSSFAGANSASNDIVYIKDIVVEYINGSASVSNGTAYSHTFAPQPISNGGTGQATANAAMNALLPSKTSNALKYLRVNSGATDYELADIGIQSSGSDVGIGAAAVTNTRLNIVQSTLGNEIMRYSTAATNDDPEVRITQQRQTESNGAGVTIWTLSTSSDVNYYIEATIVARRTGGVAGAAGDGASYRIAGLFKNVSGTLSQIGSTTNIHTAESQPGWSCVFQTAGTTVGIAGTGATDNDVTWHVVEAKVSRITN